MKYYYIHGLNATDKTSAKLLSEALKEPVEILSWDCSKKFDENYSSMLEILEKETDDYILIGKSMGGFYANALANKLLVPCTLFNPVINAKSVLNGFGVKGKIADSYEINLKDEILPRLIVIGLKDEILNPNIAINKWKGRCNLKITNDTHDIKDFKPFKDDILHLGIPMFYDINEIGDN